MNQPTKPQSVDEILQGVWSMGYEFGRNIPHSKQSLDNDQAKTELSRAIEEIIGTDYTYDETDEKEMPDYCAWCRGINGEKAEQRQRLAKWLGEKEEK